MRLSAMEGQEQVIRSLQRGLIHERVGHAYLFSGTPGVGKKTIARAFAQSILCLQPQAGDACDVCPSCRQYLSDNHPDMTWLQPDGATLKIDQIRGLRQRIRYRPYESPSQVVIMEQADTMQPPAANALLKILEEPPGPVVFILISDRGQALLETIRSRCLPVAFGPVPDEAIAAFLQGQGVAETQVTLLTLLAEGRWDRAARLAKEGPPPIREKAIALLKELPQAGEVTIFRWAEEWDKNKEGIAELLDTMALLMRDQLLINQQVPESLIVNGDCAGLLVHWPPAALLDGVEKVLAARNWLTSNVSGKLLVEDLLMTLREHVRRR
ncbi:DNA polymerase III subunit delta' [Heliophilum fasciatum]|uniref:DNA polymerase III subunit delta' n=1 Tax=Heliophilum fasciatum TaxID=35700 RepID=A0A4R2RY80_9FIRM|nr:DNA polymerase III subunit delta' [Heliophilum fasciatum]MCW2277000.1 DNA polymerase-3 subunit delta' [Heliophilum fasciatum]TCP68474.1 DNA polymerase III delta prime subunit [Heliophilum fasciatum]